MTGATRIVLISLREMIPHAEREEYIVPNKWGRKSIRSSGPQASRPRESCADFKKAGGPPFLDMRPSDVGRRLSLHVQSPPPNSLMRFWKFNFARGMRQFIRPQTPRTVLSFGSFFLGIDFGQSHALTGSARTLSAWRYHMTANWRKQKAPRSSSPAHSSQSAASVLNRTEYPRLLVAMESSCSHVL